MRLRLIVLALLVTLGAALAWVGCTGQQSGERTAATGDKERIRFELGGIEEEITAEELEAEMRLEPTPEQLKELYDSYPEEALTGWDKIGKCEVDGNCTHRAAVQQKILYLLDHPSLNPRFKKQSGEPQPCGTLMIREVWREIGKDPEMLEFYRRALSDIGGESSGLNSTSPREIGLPFVRGAYAGSESPENITELPFIPEGDPGISDYNRLNSSVSCSAGDGRDFRIYFVSGSDRAAEVVKSVVCGDRVWNFMKKVFGNDAKTLAFAGHSKPTIFIVNRPSLRNGTNFAYFIGGTGVMEDDREVRGGYMAVSNPFVPSYSAETETSKEFRYIRGDFNDQWQNPIELLESAIVHELFHWFEYSFYPDDDKFDANKYKEALAGWAAARLFPNSQAHTHKFYPSFSYWMDFPLHREDPKSRQYGAVLLWKFLSYRLPNQPQAPVKDYLHCIKDGRKLDECIHKALVAGMPNGGTPARSLVEFAEAMLNPKEPIPEQEGIVSFMKNDPGFQPHYLAGIQNFQNFHPLPDLSGADWPTTAFATTAVEFRPELREFSIGYYPFVSSRGDQINNVLTIKGLEQCTGDIACSVFGFKVDDRDRKLYKLLFHDRFIGNSTTSKEYISTEPNSEPDIVIVVIVNSGKDFKTLNVRMESRLVSAPAPFKITKRIREPDVRLECDEFDSYDEVSGELDWLDLPKDFGKKAYDTDIDVCYERWAASFDENRDDMWMDNKHLSAFLPYKSATFTANINTKTFNTCNWTGVCPDGVVREERTMGVKTVSLDPILGDSARLLVRMDPASADFSKGIFSFGAEIIPRTPPLKIPITDERTCRACCNEHHVTHWNMDFSYGFGVEGTFQDGTTVFEVASDDDPLAEGNITFSEPMEVPRLFPTNDEYRYGHLVYNIGGEFPHQMVPPLIDIRPTTRTSFGRLRRAADLRVTEECPIMEDVEDIEGM